MMSRPDVAKAVIELEHALKYDRVKLEFIKVDRLPIIDGNEITHIAGVPLRTLIYEHEADYWLDLPPHKVNKGANQ